LPRSLPNVMRIACGALMLTLACVNPERTLIEPPATTRSDFTLTVRPLPADIGVAQRLGWASGIPTAQVTLTPRDSTLAARVVVTDAAGVVTVPNLVSGAYVISATRLLSLADKATLGATDAVAFVGDGSVTVSETTRTGTLTIPASYRRSVMISEWAFEYKYELGLGSYTTGGYLELYNNGDSTVYLDGMIIADVIHQTVNYPYLPCVVGEPYTNDPTGLWTRQLAAFPGTGKQYPMPPGAIVVVATDAIDHRPFSSGLLDLRGANFEFTGAADVDNPTVPNMIDLSLEDPFKGHGLTFSDVLGTVTALEAAANPATFAREKVPPGTKDYLRLPGAGVLDVFASANTYEVDDPSLTKCPQMLNTVFDRRAGVFFQPGNTEYLVSVSRKVLATLPDGRPILQSTRTSASDFHRTSRTPGVVR
jgi:hypothetical protein